MSTINPAELPEYAKPFLDALERLSGRILALPGDQQREAALALQEAVQGAKVEALLAILFATGVVAPVPYYSTLAKMVDQLDVVPATIEGVAA